MKNQQNKPLMKKQPMLVLSLALFILIISGGYFYFRYEKKIIRQEQYSNLKSIADLKIDQITKWREERLADAKVIAEGSFIRQNFQRWLLSKDSTLEKDLLERFSLLRYNYKYEDVFVVSAGGNLLLDLNASLKHIDSETIDYCKKALQDKKAFLSDFYFSPARDTIHFDVFAPVLNDRNVPVAVLVLRVNPYDYLYPLIQSWPTSSKSAETLIIRRDGDSILYENDLRHISNTALKLRIPLTSIQTPAIQAALGHTGIYEGIDYRGVRVLADMCPVPGTPWFMIAKVDQSEIFSGLKYLTVIVIIITLLMLLFSGIGISWLYNNRQKNIYRKLLETGTALQESQEEFRATLYSIGDAVITTDIKGNIRNMNVVAEKLTGWKESDVVGRLIAEVFHIVNEESRNKVESPVQRVLKEGLVVGLANHTLLISKDGKEIPIADSGAPIRNEKGDITGVVLVFRDQTRERMAQKTLQESREKYYYLYENAPVGIYHTKIDGSGIIEINNSACEMLGFKKEELIGQPSAIRWADPNRRSEILRIMNEYGVAKNFDADIFKKDGLVISCLLSMKIFKDEGYIEGFLVDISERKQVSEKFRKLVEGAPLPLCYIDKEGVITFRNDRFIKVFGYDNIDVPTLKEWWEKAYPDAEYRKWVLQNWESAVSRAAETGTDIESEVYHVTCKDSTIREIIISGITIKDDLLATFVDITERVRAEEALKTSEERFRTAAENLTDVVYDWDIKEKVDWYGDIDGIMGYTQGGFPRTIEGWAATIHPEEKDHIMEALDVHLKSGAPYVVEYRVGRKDGEWRWWSARGTALRDHKGEPYKMIGSITDITDRKLAEEEIRDNEKRFRELIESLPQLFWTCRVDGPCDYLSKQWVEYTGVPEAEQLGYRWLEQLHPEDKDKTVSGWMEKVKTGESFDIEFRIRRYDGVYRWFKTRAVPMHDAEGNIIKWFGSNTDFQEIKKAEEQLQKLNRIYSLLSDINQAIVRTHVPQELYDKVCNIAVGQGGFGMAWIGLIDESSQKLKVIAQAGRTNGYHEQVNISLKGNPLSYCPIDSALRQGKHNICKITENEKLAPCQKTAYDLGFRSSASFPLKVSDILKGALTFYSNEPDFFDEAELKLLDELAMDISFAMEYAEKEAGRKLAEETLRESEARYKTLVENIPQKILMKDINYRWISINENLARDFGFSPEEVVGKLDRDLFSEELADKYHADDVRIITTGKTEELEEKYVVDGKETWVNTIKTAVRDDKDEIVGLLGIFWDITARKLAEEEIRKLNAELEDRVVLRTAQLEATNKELESFSYSVSHDLRAPLRHVSGYVELLNNRFQSTLSDKGRHYLDSITDSVHVMGVLIDDLLQFSRSGRAEMHQSDFDMDEIVKEVSESLSKDNPDRKIEWVQEKLPSVRGDEAMLRQVWINLISNAVKFTRNRKQARIGIGVRKEKKELVFYVRDNGVGFDMQYAQKLFGVFQRLHATEDFEGTGIGLANVQRIVLRHGGRAWAEAEPDKGAVFYFSIPNK